jgi:CheY-like chemotaxis protein
MQLPAIYIWTHDSIGLGEDGPTHQPVEHLASLRNIPGLDVVRPGDANETSIRWRTIIELAGHVRREVEALPGLHVLWEEFLHTEASHDLDPLHVLIDLSGPVVNGYDAADWLREQQRIDMGTQ